MRITHCRRADEDKDTCADDGPDSQAGQVPGSERSLELMLTVFRVGQNLLDRLGAKELFEHEVCVRQAREQLARAPIIQE